MMDVNYFGALYATKAVLDNMKIAKAGSIAFLSSQGGCVGFIGMACYSPTKYALRGLAESLQSEVSQLLILSLHVVHWRGFCAVERNNGNFWNFLLSLLSVWS